MLLVLLNFCSFNDRIYILMNQTSVLKNESEGEDFQVSRDMNWLEADTFEHETIESPVGLTLPHSAFN